MQELTESCKILLHHRMQLLLVMSFVLVILRLKSIFSLVSLVESLFLLLDEVIQNVYIPLRTRQIDFSAAKVPYIGLLIESALTVLSQRTEELELSSSNWILHQMVLFSVEVNEGKELGAI